MSFPALIIAGITIQRLATLTVQQEYFDIAPVTLQRLGDGTGLPQSHGWSKLGTSISCSGWMPAGMDGVDWKSPAGVTIACIKPLSINSPSNVITIPAGRRTDHPPRGFACVGMDMVSSPVALVGNVATITTVAGATSYQVDWLPLLTFFAAAGLRKSYDSNGNEYGWTLDAEQL